MDSLVLRLEAALGRLETAVPVRTTDQRLEAAVSRLESLLLLSSSAGTGLGILAVSPAPTSTAPPPATVSAPPSASSASPSSSAAASEPPSVSAFREMLEEYLPKIKKAAVEVGGTVEASVAELEKGLKAEEGIVAAIANCQKPDQAGLQKLVTPLGDAMGKANALTEGKRSATFNHSKAVSESMACLTWILYTHKGCGLCMPVPHIDETWPSAEFYTNKILMENKNKEGGAAHVEFAKSLKDLFTKGLKEYVKKYHLQGPSWNATGADVATYLSSASAAKTQPPPPPAAAAAAAKAPPPPPPKGPPPPPPPTGGPPPLAKASKGAAPDMSKVFASLNQGEKVTSGLKKVTADMKTKNRTDRSGFVSSGPEAATSSADKAPPAVAKAVGGTPTLELQQDRKWVVEHQMGNREIVISETKSQQTVYIFGCKNSVIQVKGKVNAITLDKCTKTALVFQDVVASCEIVNCNSVEVQCQGTAPSIAVDNTSGCQLYLSETALTTSIATAKSSEVNVLVPGATADDELIEHALPEQFINEYKNGKFITTPVSHSG